MRSNWELPGKILTKSEKQMGNIAQRSIYCRFITNINHILNIFLLSSVKETSL
jgi:hypothetical protein